MSDIVDSCPLTKRDGGVGEASVDWQTSLWHLEAYENNKQLSFDCHWLNS